MKRRDELVSKVNLLRSDSLQIKKKIRKKKKSPITAITPLTERQNNSSVKLQAKFHGAAETEQRLSKPNDILQPIAGDHKMKCLCCEVSTPAGRDGIGIGESFLSK